MLQQIEIVQLIVIFEYLPLDLRSIRPSDKVLQVANTNNENYNNKKKKKEGKKNEFSS